MNPRTSDPTKMWYDILKAEEKKEKPKKGASMKEKNAYCQKHFGCNYSECTDKQKAQCDRECSKAVKKAEDKPPEKKKRGSMPDLSGDGKVTMKDVLIGRGVIPKGSDTKKSVEKNTDCDVCNAEGTSDCPECNPSMKKSLEVGQMLLMKAMPCPICGAGPGTPPPCPAGEAPVACSRRINAMRQMRKPRSRSKMRVPRRMR